MQLPPSVLLFPLYVRNQLLQIQVLIQLSYREVQVY